MANSTTIKTKLDRDLTPESFIKVKTFLVGDLSAWLYFSDGLVDQSSLNEFVIKPLVDATHVEFNSTTDVQNTLLSIELVAEPDVDTAIMAVYNGDSLLYIDGFSEVILINAKKYPTRAVMEPPTSTVVKGSREGFTEDVMTNISLLKRRLKTPHLKFIFLKVGKQSQTTVCISYLETIADNDIVDKIKTAIDAISIDGVLDSSYIRAYLQDNKLSIFKQVGDTEKPDILTAKLLEGRVAVIVDGSPLVLTLPFLLIEDFQSAEDYYSVPHNASFLRVLRFIAMLIGVFTPGMYVAFEIFHIQFIPLRFLLTISTAIKGIPLTPNVEMLFTLFVFEILNEASIRMPKYVGTAMSVVGGLVLGDTAVQAGIISTPTILIVALSGIAAYTVPDARNTISLLRLVFLILAGTFGILGLIGGTIIVLFYLVKLSNFGVPYLAPYAPYVKNDLKDGLFKSPLPVANDRPQSLFNKNKRRLLWKS